MGSIEFRQWEYSIPEVGVGGIFLMVLATLLTVLILILFIESLSYLQNHIPSDKRRKRLACLLGVYPAAAVLSMIGLYVPGASTILNLSISLYFSVAYYQFCLLVTDYYGGYHSMLAKLHGATVSFAAPPLCCFCKCLPSFQANEKTIPRLKVAILQVCVVLPIALFIASVLWVDSLINPGNVPINFIYTALYCCTTSSFLISLYGLMMFFIVSRHHLKDYNITPKFLSISLVLAIFNVQNFLLGLLSSIIVIRCIGIEDGHWKLKVDLVDIGNADSLEELIWMLLEKSALVEIFFAGIGHYLLIFEMSIMFVWARYLYRTRKGNVETLIETEDIRESYTETKGGDSSPLLLSDNNGSIGDVFTIASNEGR
ncbi:organic solute transporter subunit alpha-like isoform X2 [Glandiceps talaboti]